MMYLRRVPLTLLAFLALIVQLLLVVGALSLFDHPGGPPPSPPALSGASPPNRDPLDPAAVPPSPSARPYVSGPLSHLLQERHQRDSRSVCSPFYLAWTGPAAAFGPRQRTTLNSIVYQMPCAPVIVLSTAPLAIDLGSVNVQNLSTALLASLSAGVPAAEEWVAKLPEWRKQSADWNAHLTDFVRYAVLYQRGGSFSDFDTIYLRSIGGIANAVGRATHPDCLWKSCRDRPFFSVHTLINWRAKSPVMRCALDAFKSYVPSCADCMGARLFTHCLLATNSTDVATLPQHYLDPMPWFDFPRYVRRTVETPTHALSKLLNAYTLHLHDSVGPIDVDSVVGHLLALFASETMQREPFLVLRHQYWLTDHLMKLDGLRFSRFVTASEARVVITSHVECLLTATSPWPPLSRVELSGTPAEVNYELQHLTVVATSERVITLTLEWALPSARGSVELTVRDMRHHVTVIARVANADALARLTANVRSVYPSVLVHAALEDAPADALAHGDSLLSLDFDAGEGTAFNRLLMSVATPFFFLVDEGFYFDFLGTQLEYLIDVASEAYDVAGVRCPEDERVYGHDLAAQMEAFSNGTLAVYPMPADSRAATAQYPDCTQVTYLHRPYLGRTASVLRVGWDADMKLAAQEDFFYTAKSNGLRVASCASTWMHHEEDFHSAVETLLSPERRRRHAYLRLMLRKHKLNAFYLFGRLVVEDSATAPLALCAPGFGGGGCATCADGFRGKRCDECAPDHYGPLCLPCRCVRGSCVSGRQSEGCVCEAGAMGMRCDLEMTPVRTPLLCDPGARSGAGWTPLGDGFRCVEEKGPDGEALLAAQATQSRNGSGLSFTYFALQSEVHALAVSVWSKAVLVSEGPPFGYSLDVSVYFMDETQLHGLHAPFSVGTHAWERRQVVIESDKAIASLRIRLPFEEHTGVARFAMLSVLEEARRLT